MAPPTAEQVAALADAMGPLRAFTLTAAWSGLRLECEVARLTREDVAESPSKDPAGQGLALADPGCTPLDGGSATLLHVRRGKGDKERHSVLFAPGLEALEDAHRWGTLFRNSCGRPWTRQAVNKHWLKARAACGLEHLVFHDLRKFHATWLLDRGVTDLDVAIQLGHFDKYGRPDADLVRRVYGFPDPLIALGRVAAAGVSTVAA